MKTITIASDFSKHPAGRYKTDGPFSGELFREAVLGPALKSPEVVVVVLDGTAGYGSSFLEEAFGGLIRNGHLSPHDAKARLRIVANDRLYEPYRQLAQKYVDDAAHR